MSLTANIVSNQSNQISVTNGETVSVTIADRNSIVGIAAASDKHYSHVVNVGDWVANGSEWDVTITHSLSKFPSITVVDSFKQTQYPNFTHIDGASVVITSRGKFSGTVYFN